MTAALLLLGIGLGGFLDGIVLHQILQWHHVLSDRCDDTFPASTVDTLQHNTTWDGVFHAGTWVVVLAGTLLLARAPAAARRPSWRGLVGLLLVGWGAFNVAEGVIDHHVLGLHHVRDDVEDPLWWDTGFLALGALLVVAGSILAAGGRWVRRQPVRTLSRGDVLEGRP
jgi:uncharacterized membrane protein